MPEPSSCCAASRSARSCLAFSGAIVPLCAHSVSMRSASASSSEARRATCCVRLRSIAGTGPDCRWRSDVTPSRLPCAPLSRYWLKSRGGAARDRLDNRFASCLLGNEAAPACCARTKRGPLQSSPGEKGEKSPEPRLSWTSAPALIRTSPEGRKARAMPPRPGQGL